MKIAIFSDLHDNLNNWQKFYSFINKEKIKLIFFVGDLTNKLTYQQIKKDFNYKIFFVSGNADLFSSPDLPEKQIIEINNLKIALTHLPDKAKKLCKNNNFDFVFYGHTHRPWINKINNTYLINPGSLNKTIRPTFAILNTKNKNINLKTL